MAWQKEAVRVDMTGFSHFLQHIKTAQKIMKILEKQNVIFSSIMNGVRIERKEIIAEGFRGLSRDVTHTIFCLHGVA
jgi:hypothetical protein